jgi:DedD protein
MAKDELNDLEKLNFSMPNQNDMASTTEEDFSLEDLVLKDDKKEEIVEEESLFQKDTQDDLEYKSIAEENNTLSQVQNQAQSQIPTQQQDDTINSNSFNNTKKETKLPRLDDILLSNNPDAKSKIDEETKKSYLVAGAALLVLFITTIVVVRLLTPKHENSQKSLVKNVEIKDEVILDNSEIEKQYQSIVAKKLKIKDVDEVYEESDKQIVKKYQPKKVSKHTPNQNNKKILKELDETPNLSLQKKLKKQKAKVIKIKQEPKKVVKKQVIKKIAKKNIKQKAKKTTINRYYEPVKPKKGMLFPSNKKEIKSAKSNNSDYSSRFKNSYSVPSTEYFIQVAAFSSKPPKATLAKVRKNNFRYKIYQVTIKGKQISKLLIGPYPSRNAELKRDLAIVKAKIVKGAFVFKSTSKR